MHSHSFLYRLLHRIETYCNDYAKTNGQGSFEIYDNLNPIVSTKNCFDDLRVEPTHVSRRPSDTYYVNKNTVLRTHTSAHQTQFISQGVEAFLCSGDVYRRDEIDASHYPVFHQVSHSNPPHSPDGFIDSYHLIDGRS
jgi:phenylalanyl-tRNA synthetase alpha chain